MTASINESPARIGNFTSSEIVALLSQPTAKAKAEGEIFGAAAKTYISECNMERRLARSLSNETTSRPTLWGQLIEKRVLYDLLGSEYQPLSTESIVHPSIPFWAGSPDAVKYDEGKTLVDVKSPMTLKSFCQMVDGLYNGLTGMDAMNYIRDNHKDGEKYYQQLVSNSILTESKYAELIVYVPYKSELDEIRELAHNYDGADQKKFTFIGFGEDSELPYLIDGGYYKNLNTIRFEVPEEDKKFLTQRVILAGQSLISSAKLISA